MSTGGKFQPGRSGNPAGKARSTRNATTLTLEALTDGETETLTRKAIELAQDGDTVALRLCLDRLLPARKDRPITFALPPIVTTDDLPLATGAIVAAVAAGELIPAGASEISKTLDGHVRAIEATGLHKRLAALETQDS